MLNRFAVSCRLAVVSTSVMVLSFPTPLAAALAGETTATAKTKSAEPAPPPPASRDAKSTSLDRKPKSESEPPKAQTVQPGAPGERAGRNPSGGQAQDEAVVSDGASSEKAEETEPAAGSGQDTDEKIAEKETKQSAEDKAKLVEIKHSMAIRHWELSKKYFGDWDWGMTQTELDLAVMDWPDLKVAHRDLCVLSLLQLDLPRSLAEFMMVVGLGDPVPLNEEESRILVESAMVKHYKKAMQLAMKGKWEETVFELQLASNLVPDDFAIHRSLAFAYGNMGRFDLAESHYKKTFELAPEDGSAHADLAYFLADQGRMKEAQRQLEEAVKASPQAAAYHVDLCWLAEARGDLNTASAELQRAVSISPKHAGLWAHLGRILEKRGEEKEAMEAYTQAVALDPSLKDAKAQLLKLRNGSAPSADRHG